MVWWIMCIMNSVHNVRYTFSFFLPISFFIFYLSRTIWLFALPHFSFICSSILSYPDFPILPFPTPYSLPLFYFSSPLHFLYLFLFLLIFVSFSFLFLSFKICTASSLFSHFSISFDLYPVHLLDLSPCFSPPLISYFVIWFLLFYSLILTSHCIFFVSPFSPLLSCLNFLFFSLQHGRFSGVLRL